METKLSNNELIEGIYHNIYSDCQDDNDYEVRNILNYRTGAFNAGEDNYIRIFNGEDWKDVAREIAEDYDKMKNSK